MSVRFMVRPLQFSDETVPLALMKAVGPAGSFLNSKHTIQHFRRTFWFPRFLDRRKYESWAAGRQDIREALNAGAIQIFADHKPVPLQDDKVRSIQELMANHKPDEDLQVNPRTRKDG